MYISKLFFQTDLERMNQELDALTSRRAALEDELSMSALKREAVQLHSRLREAEERREAMAEEERARGTPAQERERLLLRVKEDNAEIATMERQAGEARERQGHLREEQEHLEQELEENQSERNQKYRELRRREENMDLFLSSFESSSAAERERASEAEREVAAVAAALSSDLERGGRLPTAQGFSVMREDLAFKEGEAEKSRNTLEGVNRERAQLQANLEKVRIADVLFPCQCIPWPFLWLRSVISSREKPQVISFVPTANKNLVSRPTLARKELFF